MLGPKCLPGYSGVFCQACPVGTFKNDYSYGRCIDCQNKPSHSVYTDEAESSSVCSYECKNLEIYERSVHNRDCLDPLSLEFQRMGGALPFFLLLLVFLWVALVIFVIIMYKSDVMRIDFKNHPDKIFRAWQDLDESARGRTTDADFAINDATVWCHTHRCYLVGRNSLEFPWVIPKDFPRDALKKEDLDRLVSFIDDYNEKLKYGTMDRFVVYFARYCLRPFSKQLEMYVRMDNFGRLQQALYRHFPPQFWGDKGNNLSLRLGCSRNDYALAYLDFIDFGRNQKTWKGVQLPSSFLCSGKGTFNHPYAVEYASDPLVKSLVLIKYDYLKDKLPVFFENFNSQLSKLSFQKLQHQIMRDLAKTVRWVENANRCLFNHFGVKCVLFIVENQYKEVNEGAFEQRRRSFPLESVFFEAFPDMYNQLVAYLRHKVSAEKSEIKIVLKFKAFDHRKQLLTSLRLNNMKPEKGKTKYRDAISRNESVLFDESDSQLNEERLLLVNDAQATTLPLMPDAKSDDQIDSTVDNSSKEEASFTGVPGLEGVKVIVHGTTHKLVDASLRAFSTTIESSKSFEAALRKPRRKMKHRAMEAKSVVNAFYMLFFKNVGSASMTKDPTQMIMVYSLTLALDLLLLTSITLEILSPEDDYENMTIFGWAFLLFYPLVPYLAPLVGVLGALRKDISLMRALGNLNSFAIAFNVFISCLLCLFWHDDPAYLLMFLVFVLNKMVISAVSARLRQYMANPRFASNQHKLQKMMRSQRAKKE
mmetsp:Transcript_4035/g.6815  ORF Transcript_4035/g.6815 Transcript_4035/m.6815 type:complete len:761 (+) Transcript_4035:2773-5055(+)